MCSNSAKVAAHFVKMFGEKSTELQHNVSVPHEQFLFDFSKTNGSRYNGVPNFRDPLNPWYHMALTVALTWSVISNLVCIV